jgi:hypothetical protein
MIKKREEARRSHTDTTDGEKVDLLSSPKSLSD